MQRSFGAAQLSLGLVHGGDDVLAVGAEVRLGEARDPLRVSGRRCRPRRPARRPSTTDPARSLPDSATTATRLRARTSAHDLATPSQSQRVAGAARPISSLHLDDPGPRRPARPRGLPLPAGRRPRAAEHQRVAGAAAGRVARRVRGRAVPRRVAPLPRSGGDGAAHRDRRLARSRPVPGLRRQRLERGDPDPAAHLCRPRSHRRHVRADLPAARPHRAHHRLDGGRGGAVAPTSRSTPPRCAGS